MFETPAEYRLDSAWLRAFRRKLPAWYARNARDLPWRRSTDPYRVWLSEIMLQQTQIETVKPYFARFLAALPTIAALAAADEQAVLRLWEGLGYYRRARQLHQAARVIVAQHGGEFPRDPPLVGGCPASAATRPARSSRSPSTCAAPILEANTLRLFCRVIAYPGDPALRGRTKALWATAETLLPRRHAANSTRP